MAAACMGSDKARSMMAIGVLLVFMALAHVQEADATFTNTIVTINNPSAVVITVSAANAFGGFPLGTVTVPAGGSAPLNLGFFAYFVSFTVLNQSTGQSRSAVVYLFNFFFFTSTGSTIVVSNATPPTVPPTVNAVFIGNGQTVTIGNNF